MYSINIVLFILLGVRSVSGSQCNSISIHDEKQQSTIGEKRTRERSFIEIPLPSSSQHKERCYDKTVIMQFNNAQLNLYKSSLNTLEKKAKRGDQNALAIINHFKLKNPIE